MSSHTRRSFLLCLLIVAIAGAPGDAKAYFYRGLGRAQLGQHDQAIADLTESLRLQPDEAQALYNRALAYVETGQRELALQDVHALQAQGRDVPTALLRAVGLR